MLAEIVATGVGRLIAWLCVAWLLWTAIDELIEAVLDASWEGCVVPALLVALAAAIWYYVL